MPAFSHDTSSSSIPLSLFEKREELRRVLASKQFANAPKRSRFLEFVAEQSFQGSGDKLNEYLIGVEVYERGASFDPHQDPIVRVQAHEIRRALKKYYEENGSQSVLRIDLPSGHYVPIFSRSVLGAAEADEPTPPAASSLLAASSPPAQLRPYRWAIVILAVACCVLAVILAVVSKRNAIPAPQQAASSALPDSLRWFGVRFCRRLPPH
jgi:hypothetical protein